MTVQDMLDNLPCNMHASPSTGRLENAFYTITYEASKSLHLIAEKMVMGEQSSMSRMKLNSRYGMNLIKLGQNAHCPSIRRSSNALKTLRPYCSQENDQETFIPFMDMIRLKREQASRSVLVQVQSAQSHKQLFTYCNSLGKVDNMFHYSEGPEPLHFILVEFATEEDVQNVLASSTHLQESQLIPTSSHFLWFRAASKKLNKLKTTKTANLMVEDGTRILSNEDVEKELRKCGTISEQITQLYKLTRLNDISQRLRFLTAKQVESTLSGMFPNVCAYPFGSSVNGYGKMGCDLDIVLRLSDQQENLNSRLIYHCKAPTGSERSTSQRNMETIGDLINLFLPGCSQVRRILQARVPIIKYHQQLTNVECDLSMANMSGVYMSDFLYLMGEIDPRVRPLIFTIRKWAKDVLLTNVSPGRWITNFSLTLLALAFLQRPLRSPPVLPTLNQLIKFAGPTDNYVTEDGIHGTFLRDITKLNFKTENECSLESLLLEFFEFYSQFDFVNKAVCLNEAVALTKPEHSPLYIINPLERGLNVSKNVSIEELERMKIELRNAAWILESRESSLENPGLLAMFDSRKDMKQKINFTFAQKNHRLMEVSTLFQEGENVSFKNAEVQREVENIKKETAQNILRHTRQKSRR
ncbi:poly(A) RNA polymerase, mitochondrial isoform X2 [Anthonomus grandis grandis]|uniref:poly(A) RNA polymerase, mitochondrial isoform X2 n=1 Tax=Anthonomus grandis grandis TaxID=2921223 RepID=UPI002165B757|nr:poly(A) RNA polymerase, mitochondrial isoform X2 [Anthonomus grandis grandis]